MYRSDDIFLPNQLPCFKCFCTGNNRCFHLSVLDGSCIIESKQELARLSTCPIAHQISMACFDGDYYHLYNERKLHLVKMGRQAGIYDDILAMGEAPINQYEYEQMLLDTLDKLGILTSVRGMLVPG
jgi:hypothetical protein